MKPPNLKTKVFVDSGDPDETREMIKLLGFLDGQTTNPTLISKNPEARERIEKGEKFTKEEILRFYKEIVQEISGLIPEGSVSVEVYADKNTRTEEMIEQGREMFSWIPNAHIKFPTTAEGLKAARKAIDEGMRVNMTLCFTQEQAAAVYAATSGAKKGDVFVSPFIGRLDDRGENGMNLIENILRMYKGGDESGSGILYEPDSHVEVLTASVRSLAHFLYALHLESHIITSPIKILKEWAEEKNFMPDDNFVYDSTNLDPIAYKDLNLEQDWSVFDISHELTDKGIERFSEDWNALIK